MKIKYLWDKQNMKKGSFESDNWDVDNDCFKKMGHLACQHVFVRHFNSQKNVRLTESRIIGTLNSWYVPTFAVLSNHSD